MPEAANALLYILRNNHIDETRGPFWGFGEPNVFGLYPCLATPAVDAQLFMARPRPPVQMLEEPDPLGANGTDLLLFC